MSCFSWVGYVYFRRPAVPSFAPRGGLIGAELFFSATPRNVVTEGYVPFIVWFLFVVVLFAFISQRTAKLFQLFPPLKAYMLDISGSCCGILSFILMSWLQLPAYSWFIITVSLFLVVQQNRTRLWRLLLPLTGTVFLAWYQDTKLSNPDFSGNFEVHWSPYQKVEFVKQPAPPLPIFVNGIGHQVMHGVQHLQRSFYNVPYQVRINNLHFPAYRSVLVIGAGSGNDVATALLNGVKEVDAVEIDPAILNLGERFHPAQPYQDPRVRSHIDDGRAFMTSTTRR